MIAEAVRLYAEMQRIDVAELSDDYAESEARRASGSVSSRIAAWAAHLRIAERFTKPLADVKAAMLVILAAFVAIGFVAGFTTGAGALGQGGTVNILYALGAILGVQLALLALWLVLMVAAPSSRPGVPSPLGRLALWLAARLGSRRSLGAVDKAAWLSVRTLFRDGALAKWALGVVSHAVWLAFSVGALLACTVWMVLFQYDFIWETTLLRDETAIALIRALAFLPEAAHLPAPDESLIAASRWDTRTPAGRDVWSRFLLASVLVYGALPRLLALVVSSAMTYRSTAKLSIDLTEPFFSGVWQRLQPAEPSAPLEPIPPLDLGGAAAQVARRAYGSGKFFATLAVELDDPTRWPIVPVHWRQVDLGIIADRQSARRVLAQLRADFPEPRALVVVASLARSPDRGSADLLARIVEEARVPVLLVLAERGLLARRSDDPAVRERDWRRYAEAAGVRSVVVMEVDELAARRIEEIDRMIASGFDEPSGLAE